MRSVKMIFLALALLAAAGCSRNMTESAQEAPPEPVEAPAPVPAPEPAPVAEPASVAAPEPRAPQPAAVAPAPQKAAVRDAAPAPEEPAAVPAEPEPEPPARLREAPPPPRAPEIRYAVIPAGTPIHVRLRDPLDSSINLSGDGFRAILDQDILVDGKVAVPRGSVLDGKVSHVQRSGRVQGRAVMSLQLVNLSTGDNKVALQTDIRTFEAKASTKKDATKVGIGAGLGAVIGAIAGGGKGAAIGAAAGAGAGGATVMATRGEEVKLEVEQAVDFELEREVRIALPR